MEGKNKAVLMALLAVASGIVSPGAHGAEPSSAKACTTIKENAKRLVCFDAVMKAEANKPEPPAPPVPPPAPDISIPIEIKGLKIGMDASEVRNKFETKDCVSSSCWRFRGYGKAASELDSFAGGYVQYVHVDFSDGKLVDVRMTMPVANAGLVSGALTEKYGKPAREEGEFKTKGGFNGTKVTSTWSQGDSELVVESPSGSIDEMRVTLTSKAHKQKEVEKLKAKAAKDL